VVTAQDGMAALKKARRLRPDLITMDILMPGMNGRFAINTLRRDPELMRIPILVISALSGEDAAGGDAALLKPVDEGTLLDSVNSLLSRRDARCQILALWPGSGPKPQGPFFALCSGTIHYCDKDELWRRVEAGFEGIVLVPDWAARHFDISALSRNPAIQVLIMPDPQEAEAPPGASPKT
jgi:DNA-binding response OmpR family regulator